MPNFVWVPLVAVLAAISENVTLLDRAQPIERELSGGEMHAYSTILKTGDFFRAVFDQRGIDVVVMAYGPDEKKFAEVDSPNGDQGPEPVEFVAPVAGTYRFVVGSLEKNAKPGRYEARIEQWMTSEEYAAHLAAIRAAEEAASSEIRRVAIPLQAVQAGKGFADLEPLGALIGDAHVVALGEATHGTREFFQIKHRILEFLVERKGFTVFAIEATMPEAFDVNDYVLTGKGDARKALAGLYFWTWNTEEVLDMIEWMRRYNADPQHKNKVKFYGFDMQSPPRALKVTTKYLQTVDPDAVGAANDDLALLASTFSESAIDALPAPKKEAALAAVRNVLARMDAQKNAYQKKSGVRPWVFARQHAQVLAQNIENRFTARWQARDRFMAENVVWVRSQEGPGAKIVLWAHDFHVRSTAEGSMGSYLRKTFGKDMIVFGFAFDHGSFQAYDVQGRPGTGVRPFTVTPAPAGTFDAIVAAARVPIAVIDFRALPDDSPLAKWLSEPRLTRNVGSMYNSAAPDRFFGKYKMREEYDALIFVANTSSAKPNPGAFLFQFERLPAPANLDFEDGEADGIPRRWSASGGASSFDYDITTVDSRGHTGKRAAMIRRSKGFHYGEADARLIQQVEAAAYRGKRIRLRAFSRKASGSNPAFVWLTASRSFMSQSPTAFDDRRVVTGQGWQEYVIEGDIPADAEEVSYGAELKGDGEVWLDTVSIDIVEKR